MSEELIIFVKAPRAGEVKTRLAQGLGAEAACSAYRQLVGIVLENVSSLQNVELRYAPDDAADELQAWVRNGWRLRAQGGGDLGARMDRALSERFAAGGDRVVIIGSDCPDVTGEDVISAWTALRTRDLVLGPAADGGYWLIGLSRPAPILFDGMVWSVDTVLRETLRRAEAAGMNVHLLRQLRDVDTVEDWKQLQSRPVALNLNVSKKSEKIQALIAGCHSNGVDPHYAGYFQCFNCGMFYEAHDVLEELWLGDRGKPNDLFYKGLIQFAGAFVHLQKHSSKYHRLRPSAALFKLARTNLQKYPVTHERLDVSRVLALIEEWLVKLEDGGFEANPLDAEAAPKLTLIQ